MNASKNIVRLGIDSGKRTFHLSGVDAEGRIALRRKLSRQKLLSFLVRLEPCLIGMEACPLGPGNWTARS